MDDVMLEDILELQAIALFAQASAEDLAELVELLGVRSLPRGAVIFREGDTADALYIVREGRVRLSKGGATLEELGPGDALGFVAVLDQKPREVTATALADCELRVLRTDDLFQLLADRPSFMHSLFRALTTALRSQLDKAALGKKVEVA